MAAFCFGGVCVPYTAVLPLIALALKWLSQRLADLGLLPEFAAKKLGIQGHPEAAASSAVDCCDPLKGTVDDSPAGVKEITTVEEWQAELSSSRPSRPVVAKFTAEWCKPCKAIDRFYRDLATKYEAAFVKIDVDELDDVAADCSVAMMPTFVVFSGKEKKGSVSGANEGKLERLIQETCPRRVRT